MGRTKKFAKNLEEVRHFKLVARSQSDRGDEGAAPLVLEPFAPRKPLLATGGLGTRGLKHCQAR